jgi:hypothetical protein
MLHPLLYNNDRLFWNVVVCKNTRIRPSSCMFSSSFSCNALYLYLWHTGDITSPETLNHSSLNCSLWPISCNYVMSNWENAQNMKYDSLFSCMMTKHFIEHFSATSCPSQKRYWSMSSHTHTKHENIWCLGAICRCYHYSSWPSV